MAIVDVEGAPLEFDQSGSGPDLLLVHSLLTESSVFVDLIPRLATRYRLTTINLPGYGGSVPRPFTTMAAYGDFIAQTMDALALPKSTHVFGNGFGAFATLMFALAHGDRFDRLILADVNAGFPDEGKKPFGMLAERVSTQGMSAVLDAAIARMFPEPFIAANPAIVADRKAKLGAADPAAFARACRALAALDVKGEVGAIKNKTLVLCGGVDRTTPPELARDLAERIPGAKYREIPGCGHCPMLETPAVLAEMMTTFLA
ncbi:MAG: alpha/beta fold hydrolase [Burkholderiales bacterium]